LVLTLKEGALEEYIRHHDSIPSSHPDLVEAFHSSGVKAMRIFVDGDRLVLCLEADDDQAMQRLWATEAHQRWSELMEPLIALGPDGVPMSNFLTQVYEFDGG
jgi:L-rhamnose mutarotase